MHSFCITPRVAHSVDWGWVSHTDAHGADYFHKSASRENNRSSNSGTAMIKRLDIQVNYVSIYKIFRGAVVSLHW